MEADLAVPRHDRPTPTKVMAVGESCCGKNDHAATGPAGAFAKATLVVCPVVAVIQWRNEIAKHVKAGSLKVNTFHVCRGLLFAPVWGMWWWSPASIKSEVVVLTAGQAHGMLHITDSSAFHPSGLRILCVYAAYSSVLQGPICHMLSPV